MNDLRLARGRALLAETDMKVTEVAIACGYASASHFSKSFRKKYGVSPYRFSHFGA
jgi:transcriptional regulator GlxA family with amidase domain